MLQGRRVLVTGGSRGIGAVIVETLVREGASVALHYARSEHAALAIQERLGSRVVAIQADLSQPGAARALWAATRDRFEAVDAVVLNAATFQAVPLTAPDDVWDQAWQRTLDVNLKSVADLMREALPHFQERRAGIFVSIASRAAFRGDDPENLAYAASKGGMVAVTRSIARAYARDGVLAYLIAPGFVRTEMAEQALTDPAVRARILAEIPMGEMAAPEDVAEVTAFLVSGRAPHMTGATLDINGASYVR